LLLTMDFYDERRAQIAQLRRNQWAFQRGASLRPPAQFARTRTLRPRPLGHDHGPRNRRSLP
jgi:hypothetical protein